MPGSFVNVFSLHTVGISTPNPQMRKLSLQRLSEPLEIVLLASIPAGHLLGSEQLWGSRGLPGQRVRAGVGSRLPAGRPAPFVLPKGSAGPGRRGAGGECQ